MFIEINVCSRLILTMKMISDAKKFWLVFELLLYSAFRIWRLAFSFGAVGLKTSDLYLTEMSL